MIDIYLSVNNSEEVIHIPVTPPQITIKSTQGTETFETSGYGLIRIIGSRELQAISWETFFPVHEYPFLRDTSMKGQEYADKINNWRDRKLPIRLVITSNGFANIDVNIACAITQFDGEVGSNGDYNYTIQLDEVDLLNYTLNNEEEITMAQIEDIINRLDAIEERMDTIESGMVYRGLDDNLPEWAKPTVKKLVDKGYLAGIDDNDLGLTMNMIRVFVVMDNAGVFD